MQDSSLMQVIKKETKMADEEKMETWTVEERKNTKINAKAMNTLICALCLEEFDDIYMQNRSENMGQIRGNM